jgi:hypothetical protein
MAGEAAVVMGGEPRCGVAAAARRVRQTARLKPPTRLAQHPDSRRRSRHQTPSAFGPEWVLEPPTSPLTYTFKEFEA